MTSLVFPDINVWVALHYHAHRHCETARSWLETLEDEAVLVFCRHTQLGLFRLLTTEAVLGPDLRTQKECWTLFDQWMESGRAVLAADPPGLDNEFRKLAEADSPSPKSWADAYLSAFARTGKMPLVTFDRALAAKAKGAVLLG